MDEGEILEPSPEEAKAIRALERLARQWPSTVGLFSWSGSLCVVRLDEGDWPTPMEPAILAKIDIQNDGGDPD